MGGLRSVQLAAGRENDISEREQRQCLITVELETGEGAQALTCGFECRGQEALAAANAI